jgi:hypothetical protein
MTQELTVLPSQQIINVADSALSIDQIVKQRELITNCMAKAMKEGQHYGKVPGCGDKPTLFQPGAQLLAHLFRLRPEYDVIETDLPNDHKRFRLTCRLFFIGATPEIRISEGVGESSSMESKHRFRNAAAIVTPTGDAVPSTYWDIKNKNGPEAAKKWAATAYDGKQVSTKKIEGAWQFVIIEGGSDEKVENANPADVFNTVLKMAKKRAFVDATITATASSDFFTQDLEDIRDNLLAVEEKSAEVVSEKTVQQSGKGEVNGNGSDKRPADSGMSVGNWRDVTCTYGKKAGPLRGKKLGELNDDSLEYLAKIFLADGKEIKPSDRKMVAALAIWKAETAKPSPALQVVKNEGKFNGKNHETLFEQIVWANIKPEDFIAAMKAVKAIPENATNFSAMSDETAKTFLDDFENAEQHVKHYLAGKSEAAS